MRNFVFALCATALFASGCAPERNEAIANAMPDSQAVTVKVPEQTGDQPLVLGEIAEYYRLTREISRNFNGGAVIALTILHLVVQYPPTSVDGDTYTWGPHSDALDPAEWRLDVTDNLDGTYDYVLVGRNKTEPGAEFLPLLTGRAVEGLEANRGTGNFTWNGDNARLVNPIDNPDDNGTVTVVYDLENRDGTQASLDMDIQGTDKDSGEPVSATYHYAENVDGSGDFQFELKADLDDEGSLQEEAVIRSRWLTDGQGRSDVQAQGGDLGDIVLQASECWNQQFRRVYYSDSEEWAPTEGESTDCVFADADLPGA